MKVLLVEDDRKLGQFVQNGLQEVAYTCVWARNCQEAREAVSQDPFDVIILDINLPDASGLQLLTEWRQRLMPAYILTPAGPMDIAISLRNFSRVNDCFFLVMLCGLPMIAVFSILVGMRMRRSTLEPVRMIELTASLINASNLNERVPVPRGDSEMAGLARLLNQMFDRLENSFKQVKRFTADTSHELMTPLTLIRLHAEGMRNETELPVRVRQSLDCRARLIVVRIASSAIMT